MTLSIEAKDAICPQQFAYGGLCYSRKNVNQTSVSYICSHKASENCKATLKFSRIHDEVDFSVKITKGVHTRNCFIKNNIDVSEYQYEGKSKAEGVGDDKENVDPNRLKCVEEPMVINKRMRLLNVTEEMKRSADNLARNTLTLDPSVVWEKTKTEMDEKYTEGWSGIQKDVVVRRVRKARAALNGGNAFQTLLNSNLIFMTDSDRKFLQASTCLPNINSKGNASLDRLMIFGNPALFGLLKEGNTDLYIDATFDCCPSGFYQCLIVMIYCKQTSVYVPILYILMSNKTQELYCRALSEVIHLSNHMLNVNSFTSDFEYAIINSCQLYFPEGYHIGCLFHLKQAWRRHLITKLAFLAEDIKLAMKVGVLDFLCIIPQDEISTIGIPYVRSVIEENLDPASIAKWDTFWAYFDTHWMSRIDSWNICLGDNTYKRFINRTNNGLERYNKRFNGLFSKHNPSLMEFVEIVEKESRYYATKLADIRSGKEADPLKTRDVQTIPEILEAYKIFKASHNRRMNRNRRR